MSAPLRELVVGDGRMAYLDVGSGPAVLLLHGSGPGSSGLGNWSGTLPALAGYRAIVPDLFGFGASRLPSGRTYTVEDWSRQSVELLDALGIERVAIVGNSLGGRIALELALRVSNRVDRLVLMGSGGLLLEPTAALRAIREYVPSRENMERLITECFLFDPSLATPEIVEGRYQASLETYSAYRTMFGADRRGLVIDPERLRDVRAPALVVHGRDDRVIPVEHGVRIADLLPLADLHVFARCGHWAQVERSDEFNALVANTLATPH